MKRAWKDEAIPGSPVIVMRSTWMRYGMPVGCIAMMLPGAGYLLRGGTLEFES